MDIHDQKEDACSHLARRNLDLLPSIAQRLIKGLGWVRVRTTRAQNRGLPPCSLPWLGA